ncbi:hypothetical protein KUTeg_006142 [Tegillarca granosa]|uniref:Rho-GAP domain-containing protein n=1 Tax=Tegillarca granosa TaxID=220873 RepID=A0ABQ9FFL9_TEGGR|nr:hypothetical protein KUTeg_006142 [Tegillarca granosa]
MKLINTIALLNFHLLIKDILADSCYKSTDIIFSWKMNYIYGLICFSVFIFIFFFYLFICFGNIWLYDGLHAGLALFVLQSLYIPECTCIFKTSIDIIISLKRQFKSLISRISCDVNFDTFDIVVIRKHGKFLSFLRMFFSTRPARTELKQSGIVKERVFGCDLGEHLLNSDHEVPQVLISCAEVIENYGIVDGIYRLSGITSNIQKLRNSFDEVSIPDLTSEVYLQDIHSISSLLKMYFRELPNPLLTYQLYDKFAEAVRDEDNKLWKVHDVVQQLPPPHYRTTQYLMRHLARVAAFGNDTGMHSKNLAIVWAPNLLRSKELESGGGAAALQGVGIQAVVTECLIVYADLIFSDKMPSYSSPELKNSHRKPRPKSLAISTPTKLISLEEARERALSASLRPPPQKYIEVGGGPKKLPTRYHTVLDLPGYKKKALSKDSEFNKAKKSPSGWRSIFTKSGRQGSMKQKDPLELKPLERKAITEEDVHNWKRRRLRGAKSAESLLNLASSSCDTTLHSNSSMILNVYSTDEDSTPRTKHKRSLSSDSPRALAHSDHSISYPSFITADSASSRDETEGSGRKSERKPSFVRGDKKRQVIPHRKTPSAPSTPRQDLDRGSPPVESRYLNSKGDDSKQKASSQPILDSVDEKHLRHEQVIRRQDVMSLSASGRLDSMSDDKFVLRLEDVDLLKSEHSKSDELRGKRKGSKTPPRERRKFNKEEKQKEKSPGKESVNNEIVTIDLPESPGAKRKNWLGSASSTPASTPEEPPTVNYYYSRHHDYAEILSDEEKATIEGKVLSKSNDDIINVGIHDRTLTDESGIEYSSENIPMDISPHYGEKVETTFPSLENQDVSQTNYSPLQSLGPYCSNSSDEHSDRSFYDNQDPISETSPTAPVIQSKMSKCLSVPSDIQKSLENLNSGSQSDLLSSITLSELSTSVDSFNVSFNDDLALTHRSRRSVSLDSLKDSESPLTRTLREINAQIDDAFKKDLEKAHKMQEHVKTAKLVKQEMYDNVTTESRTEKETTFGINTNDNETSTIVQKSEKSASNVYVDRPMAEVQVIETARVIRAPLQPSRKTKQDAALPPVASQNEPVLTKQDSDTSFTPGKETSKKYSVDRRIGKSPEAYEDLSPLSMLSPLSPMSPMSPTTGRPPFGLSGSSDEDSSKTSSPVQSRPHDSKRSTARHGKVQFELSEEDLNFLSMQGRLTESQSSNKSNESLAMDKKDSSGQSETESPKTSPSVHRTQPTSPPAGKGVRDFPELMFHSNKVQSPQSSPRSPRQQPRWEDLAGLNQDFRAMAGLNNNSTSAKDVSVRKKVLSKTDSFDQESPVGEEASFDRKLQDLSDFNEIWRKQLAPTGDVCRLTGEDGSRKISQGQTKEVQNRDSHVTTERPTLKKSSTIAAMEMASHYHDVSRERTPECGNDEQTVTIEKPMIKKCMTDLDIPQIKHCTLLTQDSHSTTSSSGVSESVQEVNSMPSGGDERNYSEMHSNFDMYGTEKSLAQNIDSRKDDVRERSFYENADDFDITAAEIFSNKNENQDLICGDISSSPDEIMDTSDLLRTDNSAIDNLHNMTIYQNQLNPVLPAIRNPSEQSMQGNLSLRLDSDPVHDQVSTSETMVTTNQDGQLQTHVIWYTENTGPGNTQAESGVVFSPVLDEIDINESCFGIPTHQNLSNEMREKMQEKLKAKSGGRSDQGTMPALETVQVQGSFIYQEQSGHELHVGFTGQRMEVESTLQFSSEVSSVNLPAEDIQMLTQGPTLVADPQIINQIDNTEEAFQNEINAERELSMSLRSDSQRSNAGGNLPRNDDCCQPCDNTVLSPGLEHLNRVSPRSVSSAKSEFGAGSYSFYSPHDSSGFRHQNVDRLPELAPPEQEVLELSRPRFVKRGKSHESKSGKFAFKEGVDKSWPQKDSKRLLVKSEGCKCNDQTVSERGESKLILDRKPSFQKKSNDGQSSEQVETENNDDVFVDPSEVKCTPALSASQVGSVGQRSGIDQINRNRSPLFVEELPSRSSLDESYLQMASDRHGDYTNLDIEQEGGEDIRFVKAHKSAKLQTLKELFEKTNQEHSKRTEKKRQVSDPAIQSTKLVCLPKSPVSERSKVSDFSSPVLATSKRSAFAKQRSYSQTERFTATDFDREISWSSHSPSLGGRTNGIHDEWHVPRSRRSISTDVGLEFGLKRDFVRGDKFFEKHSVASAGKPPRHRSSSRNRTPSESSVSEAESSYRISSTRSSPKSPRQDGSPKCLRDTSLSGSPKSAREKVLNPKWSPESQRTSLTSSKSGSTESSPKFVRHEESSKRGSHLKSDGSPRSTRHVSFQHSDSPESSPKSVHSFGSPGSRRSVTMETVDSEVLELIGGSGQAQNRMSQSLTMISGGMPISASNFENGSNLERKGSIKELRHFFETKQRSSLDESSRRTPPPRPPGQYRFRSVSPTVGIGSRESQSQDFLEIKNVRHSLELPPGSSLSHSEGIVRPQAMRMGPKPFYGARK